MTDKRDAIAAIEVPLAVDDTALSRPGLALGWDSARAARYAEALATEIRANAGQFDDCIVRAVRFGGGVATNLGRGAALVMRALRESLVVDEAAPVTMSASVANISGATFPFFRRAGVSRFDFELLSLDSADFTRLNRVDNLADFPVVCDHFLHAYANRSLGVTLAFGYVGAPGRDALASARRSALAAAGERVSHVRLVPAAGPLAADEPSAQAQREAMADALISRGFAEYLPLLFARPGEEDLFELLDASGAVRLGFGAGAKTRIDGAQTRNTAEIERYCAHSGNFALITESASPLPAP